MASLGLDLHHTIEHPSMLFQHEIEQVELGTLRSFRGLRKVHTSAQRVFLFIGYVVVTEKVLQTN